jgi:hypothetical protein
MNMKPQLYVIEPATKDVRLGYTYPTYRMLRSKIKQHLAESYDNQVRVYRTRRGTWGEWFEYWSLVNGKPKITKQGWQ